MALVHLAFAAGSPLHATAPRQPHYVYHGDMPATSGSLVAVLLEHSHEQRLMQNYRHGTPNIILEARVCECGLVHIYALATQIIRHGDPLVCAQCPWRWIALVAHFDGSCHRSDCTGGAGVIVRKFYGDNFDVLEQTAYPLLDCPDSYHAEGFASAYAVQALARHFPSHTDVQECVIIGDNSSILNYWRRTARVRRTVLVRVLQQAQLLAATELPRISWRYVPIEANKEAIWESSDIFFHYWGNQRVDHAANEAVTCEHPEVLRRRDNAGRLVRVKKLFYVAVYGAYAKLQKCYDDSRERSPVQERQRPLSIQDVGEVPPPHFKVVPLHAAETLRWCSHWTHTFTQALYTWIGSLAWPSSPVNTGYVAWAELLASFKYS